MLPLLFSSSGIKSTNNFLNLGIELRSNGLYVVATPSVINEFQYTFEVPLSEIRPLPKNIVEQYSEGEPKQVVEYRARRILKLPRYNGLGVACIGQIIDRDLQEGERNNSLFIYSL